MQAEVRSQSTESAYPQVFLIGEYEDAFKKLMPEHPQLLLSVCGDDMDFAYEKWLDMLVAIEDFAKEVAYDIRGLKVYLYVFWNADGSIEHLAFYPKPNSRNVPVKELTAFFKEFSREYRFNIETDSGFSHYGSATFPTYARPGYKANR